ncbi:hypothetical protein [Halobellus sp. Atlit-38R]|uniref:hypothetical protein n=1 Tax=Halobellus sp. Atlit-38R TaxID=2282131 RepID=UPI001F3F9D73|nr:hypothetical protein [Halobellus sp. Atlit-38R]
MTGHNGTGEDPSRPLSSADSASSATDPHRIRSLAVTTADVVDGLEAASRSQRAVVLRVTPPFSGRMRARIHDAGIVGPDEEAASSSETDAVAVDSESGSDDAPSPIHFAPERFVADPPSYPTVDDTEDELRASGIPYTRERHRERHQEAVDEWREQVRERLVEEVTLETATGPHTVSVSYLG